MNEELKIIIKAFTDPAKKAVKAVKDEIEATGDAAKKHSKSISDSMKSIAKGATIALTSISAVTTALILFGKSTTEAQKNISKLNAAFQSSGGNAKQANEVYKNLYRFMGDSDSATEAAQNLSRITTNTQDLAEWTKILQGVYARAGDAIPIESLAEAANETIQVGKVTGVMADALNWVGVSEDAFNAKLAQTTSLSEREALVRGTLNSLYMEASNIYERNNQALLANQESQARLDIALAETGRYILPLMTALNDLSATLLNFLAPAIRTVVAYFTAFIRIITSAIAWVGAFFGMFNSKAKSSTLDIADIISKIGNNSKISAGGVGGLNKALGGAAKAAKELKKQTMGFDELNIISKQPDATGGSATGGGGVGGGGGGIDIPKMSDLGLDTSFLDMQEFNKQIDEAEKKLKTILTIVGVIGTAFGLWKLTSFISDLIKASKAIKNLNKIIPTVSYDKATTAALEAQKKGYEDLIAKAKFYSGLLLVIAGSILTIKGYCDAWINGIDWGNFATMLGGIALTIGGVALALGTVKAGLMSMLSGFLLISVALKDISENGYNLQNALTLIIGSALVVAGAMIGLGASFSVALGGVLLIVGGISTLIDGLKNLSTNGPTVNNVLTIMAGTFMAVTGVILLFNAALLASPIGWVIAGVSALVVGIGALVVHFKKKADAIKDAKTAQEDYNNAINDSINAQKNYTSAIDRADEAQKRLAEAEKNSKESGKELFEKVQSGTITYTEMTDAQKETYKAYIENEQAQKDAKKATEEMETALKKEKQAALDVQLANLDSAESYNTYKESVIKAYQEGTISAEDAQDRIEKAMKGMSTEAKQAFVEDIPKDIKKGLNPNEYETFGTRLSNWWKGIKTNCANYWNDFPDKMKKHFENAKNGAIEKGEKIADDMARIKNDTVSKFNPFADDIKTKFADAKDKAKAKFAEITSAENLGKVKDDIVTLFSDIGTKAGEAIGGAVKSAINGAITVIENRINDAIDLINGAIKLINKIPGVNVSKVGKIKLKRLAEGGIVDSATIAMIGEAGKEAVVPLENNTEWMDKLADRIASRNNKPTKVVLQVKEKELGYATINAINGITEQTGGLQLVL